MATPDANANLADADPGLPDAAAPDAMVTQLVDTGLVVRYFIDDDASGTDEMDLEDYGPSPDVDLPITFGQAEFVEENGNRGLRWDTANGTGKCEIALSSPKITDRLRQAPRLTMEIVLDIDDAGPSGSLSNLIGMRGGNPDFMMLARDNGEIHFRKPYGSLSAIWPGVDTGERMVLHLVWDTSQVTATDRVRLYKNGVLQAKTTDDPPNQGATVGLGGSDALIVGNTRDQTGSIAGAIYYAAFYDVPLSDPDIANNVARLMVDDDQ